MCADAYDARVWQSRAAAGRARRRPAAAGSSAAARRRAPLRSEQSPTAIQAAGARWRLKGSRASDLASDWASAEAPSELARAGSTAARLRAAGGFRAGGATVSCTPLAASSSSDLALCLRSDYSTHSHGSTERARTCITAGRAACSLRRWRRQGGSGSIRCGCARTSYDERGCITLP